jgi:glycosyltransferase involved in cell wall biosynthesis
MTSITPRVSVAMPVYNAEQYLSAAVESILNQSFIDFEFVIINDGSTDQSLQILESYAARDPRIRLISRPNTGYTKALNETLALARGVYYARMDADDMSFPDRLRKQVAYLDANPDCLVVGCRVELIDPEGQVLGEVCRFESHDQIDAAHLAGQGGVIVHPSATMRLDAVKQIGGYHLHNEPAEDLDLLLRLAENGRLAKLPDVLFQYRMHFKSVGHTRRMEQAATVARIVNDARARRGLPQVDPSTMALSAPPHPSVHFLNWASLAMKYGNRPLSAKYALRALRRAPMSIHGWSIIARLMLPRRFFQTHGPGFKG